MSDNEQKLQELYTQILQPGDFAIDVGAHFGRHTLPMMQCVGPEGEVWAFEPIPDICRALAGRIRESSLGHVARHFEMALSDAPAVATFELVNEAPGYSGLRERRYDFPVTRTQIQVKVETLDRIIPEPRSVRLIKVDCEGAELLVLRGARNTIARCRPFISIESGDSSLTHYPYTSGDLFDFLESFGYRIVNFHGMVHSREAFVEANHAQAYWDYLAIPDSDDRSIFCGGRSS